MQASFDPLPLNRHIHWFIKRFACHRAKGWAVGISGGSDSLALILLLRPWSLYYKIPLFGLGVDHTLRPESATEAHWVRETLKAYGLDFYSLAWEHGGEVAGNVMAQARHHRYQSLLQGCYQLGASHLFLGHHLDDTLETLYLREKKASWRGLGGIASSFKKQGIYLGRPLLPFRKKTLQKFLLEKHQPWIEDPSNQNPLYQRNRIRLSLQTSFSCPKARQALKSARIYGAQRDQELQNIQAAFQRYGQALFPQHLEISTQFWKDLPPENCLPSINFLIESVRGSYPSLSLTRQQNFFTSLQKEPNFKATFGQCIWEKRKGTVRIFRQWSSLNPKDGWVASRPQRAASPSPPCFLSTGDSWGKKGSEIPPSPPSFSSGIWDQRFLALFLQPMALPGGLTSLPAFFYKNRSLLPQARSPFFAPWGLMHRGLRSGTFSWNLDCPKEAKDSLPFLWENTPQGFALLGSPLIRAQPFDPAADTLENLKHGEGGCWIPSLKPPAPLSFYLIPLSLAPEVCFLPEIVRG